jgi:hypothetical protein
MRITGIRRAETQLYGDLVRVSGGIQGASGDSGRRLARTSGSRGPAASSPDTFLAPPPAIGLLQQLLLMKEGQVDDDQGVHHALAPLFRPAPILGRIVDIAKTNNVNKM